MASCPLGSYPIKVRRAEPWTGSAECYGLVASIRRITSLYPPYNSSLAGGLKLKERKAKRSVGRNKPVHGRFRHNPDRFGGMSLPETPSVAVLFRPSFGFFREIIFDQILVVWNVLLAVLKPIVIEQPCFYGKGLAIVLNQRITM